MIDTEVEESTEKLEKEMADPVAPSPPSGVHLKAGPMCDHLHKRSVPYSTSLNPLSYIGMAWTGTSPRDAIDSEHALLSRYVKTPFELGRVPINMSSIGLGKQYINMISFNPDVEPPKSEEDPHPIVWLHGAGAGLGFAYRNYDTLCNLGGVRRRVFGVDWLGQAGSSRPSYPYGWGSRKPAWMLSEAQQVDAAITFSVSSLEAWRAALGIDRFDLVAHSMGGYLATQYAMAYPHRVRRLVLVSPVGWAAKPEGELARGRAGGLIGALWDSGLGNFGILRTFGRCASATAKGVLIGRTGVRDADEAALLTSYFWSHATAEPISSEKAINYLLEPYFSPAPFGFYAKRPVSTEPAERLASLPPTTLLYGSHDLHYIETMPDAVSRVAAASPHGRVAMHFVRRSDHHLYIDNPEEFHQRVEEALA